MTDNMEHHIQIRAANVDKSILPTRMALVGVKNGTRVGPNMAWKGDMEMRPNMAWE